MSEVATRPSKRRAVLIVEDERPVCDLLSEMAEDAGFEAHCVQSDEEAYAALRERGADFVCMIVDVNLGKGATGYDVARYARRIVPGLPVIYVSGQTTESSHKANGVPGSLFVPKPFTADELMERISMLVGDNDDDR